jgi:hypothetical protein
MVDEDAPGIVRRAAVEIIDRYGVGGASCLLLLVLPPRRLFGRERGRDAGRAGAS